jgi:hypothetical protein
VRTRSNANRQTVNAASMRPAKQTLSHARGERR